MGRSVELLFAYIIVSLNIYIQQFYFKLKFICNWNLLIDTVKEKPVPDNFDDISFSL